MNDFLETIPENPSVEHPNELLNNVVHDSINEIKQTTDLGASDESWLENLFDRIGNWVEDVFDISDDGYDTERIAPKGVVTSSTDVVAEYNLNEATEEWHVQEANNSCAVCAQQFIINEFLDIDVSEAELSEIAEINGWYDPESGTSPQDADNLLQLYGIDTQINEQGTIMDIKETLDQGGRVIVGVDSEVLWTDGFGNYPLSGADHAIEVIGLDDSDPNNVKVIVNDSGIPDGCGKEIPLSEFLEAWETCGGFMISAMANN